MRNLPRIGWQFLHRRKAMPGGGLGRSQLPLRDQSGRRVGGWLAAAAVGMAVVGGPSSAWAAEDSPELSGFGGEGSASDPDGLVWLLSIEPNPEDFEDPIDFQLAYLRWLYVLLGGDPRDVEPLPAPEPDPEPALV